MSSSWHRAGLGLSMAISLLACAGEDEAPAAAALDTRLETHAVLPGTPSPEGLAYVEAMAELHRRADALDDPAARAELLIAGLERHHPSDDGSAELLRLDLAARAAESFLAAGQAARARELLAPMVAPSVSLPIDRASARCLVALGDAAAASRDTALAMQSYARALEMLSLLLEEVEP